MAVRQNCQYCSCCQLMVCSSLVCLHPSFQHHLHRTCCSRRRTGHWPPQVLLRSCTSVVCRCGASARVCHVEWCQWEHPVCAQSSADVHKPVAGAPSGRPGHFFARIGIVPPHFNTRHTSYTTGTLVYATPRAAVHQPHPEQPNPGQMQPQKPS